MQFKDIWFRQQHINKRLSLEFFSYHFDEEIPFCPTMCHEELFVACLMSGNGEIIIDGARYHLNVGDIVVLPPFTLYTWANWDNLQIDCCLSNLRGLQNNKNTLTYPSSANMQCVVTADEEKHAQINQAILQLKLDRQLQHMCLIDIQNILHWLHLRREQKDITSDKHLFAIKNTLNIVHTQREQLVVKELADQCGYSEFYMMKLFKKFTGYSCIDYSINYKLLQIALKMATCDDDFCKLATEMGFANISYFNRQFKKLFGVTPKTFRKTHQNNC